MKKHGRRWSCPRTKSQAWKCPPFQMIETVFCLLYVTGVDVLSLTRLLPAQTHSQYPILIQQLTGTFCLNSLSFLIFPLPYLYLHLFRVRIFFTPITCPFGFSEWPTPASIQQCQTESCFLLDPGYQPFLKPENQVSLLVNCLWIITPQLSPCKFYRIYKYTATKHYFNLQC